MIPEKLKLLLERQKSCDLDVGFCVYEANLNILLAII
jgi:hypothetical protein